MSNMPMLFGNNISDSERRLRTLRSLAGVFQRTLRILSGQSDLLAVVADKPNEANAAWTEYTFGAQGNRVVFNLPHVGRIDTSADIVRLTGLAHHERCHLTFTPGIKLDKRDPIGRVFNDRGTQADYVFNVLEDQRIETLDVANLPAMRHYYSATVAGYILNGNEDEMKLSWLLVYGRRYLGADVINGLESVFKFPEHITQIKRIIDSYRKLNLFQVGDRMVAGRLVEEMCDLLFDQMQEQPKYQHPSPCKGQHGGAGSGSDRDQAENAQARVAAQDADDEDDEEEGDEDSNGSGGSEEGEGDDEDGEGEGDGGEDGEGSDGDQSESNSRSGGGQGVGEGTRDSNANQMQDAIEALADALDQAVNHPDVQTEVKNNLQAMKNAGARTDISKHNGWVHDDRANAVLAARVLSKRLERMREDMDPGWENNLHSGRLDVQRAIITRDPLGDVWSQWNEGKVDACDVETVVITDQSGSMQSYERQLSDAVWSIKHGHDKIGASCTVWGFDTQGFLIYNANDRAQVGLFPSTPSLGGTNPFTVLVEAARVLANSKRKRKIFISLTDGIWGNRGSFEGKSLTPNDIVAQMNGAGILTAMVYLTGAYDARNVDINSIDWHNHQVRRLMSNLDGFAAFGDELLREVMKK